MERPMGRGYAGKRKKVVVANPVKLFPNERVRIVPLRRTGRIFKAFAGGALVAFNRGRTLGVFEAADLRHIGNG
jgi:hypothetical protein